MSVKGKKIAIDWDGTVVKNGQYPEIGEPKPNAINVLQRIVNDGGKVAIWTCRGGKKQEQGIVDKLHELGFTEFIINKQFPDVLDEFEEHSPKIFADLYIDDRALFAQKEIDWYEVERILFPEDNYEKLFNNYFNIGGE
jgi:hypothetical protein